MNSQAAREHPGHRLQHAPLEPVAAWAEPAAFLRQRHQAAMNVRSYPGRETALHAGLVQVAKHPNELLRLGGRHVLEVGSLRGAKNTDGRDGADTGDPVDRHHGGSRILQSDDDLAIGDPGIHLLLCTQPGAVLHGPRTAFQTVLAVLAGADLLETIGIEDLEAETDTVGSHLLEHVVGSTPTHPRRPDGVDGCDVISSRGH